MEIIYIFLRKDKAAHDWCIHAETNAYVHMCRHAYLYIHMYEHTHTHKHMYAHSKKQTHRLTWKTHILVTDTSLQIKHTDNDTSNLHRNTRADTDPNTDTHTHTR